MVSSAAWFTTHIATFWGLWRRMPERRRLLLLAFPPTAWLAVVWGFRNGLRNRAWSWLAWCAVYLGTALMVQW